ncbi:MAG: D-glycero-beta-D-manno-heptose 1-phosphate adenylyltransferase [Prolixibacteraceae bacterium]|nr:D-glycero-beta-D-manno-heptose 1-phosphate adenylyltransferase [Prolixibacteraceae bacterium]
MHFEKIKAKIYPDYQSFFKILNAWKKNKEIIVFTNGCFDILHRGHIEYLSETADLGNRLVIGLNSDESVKILKGQSRPFINEESRAILLASLEFVDAVVLFSEETPYNLISDILPDVLVKGEDYTIEEIAGFDVVLANGGKVETIKLVPGFSTTSIINKIKNQGNE